MNIMLEKARLDDVNNIVDLVNLAYRGDAGWTKESELIQGDRVSKEIINSLLKEPEIHFLVAYSLGDLLCCICIEHSANTANIGFFAVNPKLQELGVGKSVLEQAEHYAITVLNVKKFAMQVISQRPELVDYYLRRGYKKLGLVRPYPKNLNSGSPSIDGLTIVTLEKKR